MPFGRLFRGKPEEPAPTRDPAADDLEAPDADPADEVPPEWDDAGADLDRSWRRRAADAIPGGSSTGSKQPDSLYGTGNEVGPTHFTRALGCRLTTAGEATLIDCTMALGSVTIGYGDERIVRAAITAAANGNVAGLAHTAEVELAERLGDVIPCAEQVRFFKSGGEAVAVPTDVADPAQRAQLIETAGDSPTHHAGAEDGQTIPLVPNVGSSCPVHRIERRRCPYPAPYRRPPSNHARSARRPAP